MSKFLAICILIGIICVCYDLTQVIKGLEENNKTLIKICKKLCERS